MSLDCADTIAHLFDSDRIVGNFSSLDQRFPTERIPVNPPSSPLPQGDPLTLPAGTSHWIGKQSVTSIVVLKQGELVHESYHRETAALDRRMSWSIAKSILSVLFGVLYHKNLLPSLDTPVTQLTPRLAGSAYDGVTLDQLLQMTSGVCFNEDYHDPASDIRKLARYLGRGGGLTAFVAARRARHAAPGEIFAYNSLDTQALGLAIQSATGRRIAALLSEHLFESLGCEASPSYLTDARGVPFVLGGIVMRTRDFARFGQLIAQDGFWNGRQIIPQAWVRRLDQPRAPTPPDELRYGDQWWMPADASDGEVLGCGIYGQYIYVNRTRNTVCAVTSANRAFSEDGVFDQALEQFRRLAEA